MKVIGRNIKVMPGKKRSARHIKCPADCILKRKEEMVRPVSSYCFFFTPHKRNNPITGTSAVMKYNTLLFVLLTGSLLISLIT